NWISCQYAERRNIPPARHAQAALNVVPSDRLYSHKTSPQPTRITLSFSLRRQCSSLHSFQPPGLVPRLLDSLFYFFPRDLAWLIVHIDGIQDRVDLYVSYPSVLSDLLTNYLRA